MKKTVLAVLVLLLSLSMLSCKAEPAHPASGTSGGDATASAPSSDQEVSYGNGVYYIPYATFGKRLAELKGSSGISMITPVTDSGTTVGYYVIVTTS